MADVDAKALVTVLGGQITRDAAVALLRQDFVYVHFVYLFLPRIHNHFTAAVVDFRDCFEFHE
jgi:hypothetical protein